ncbi:hypothetical protein [Streptomyces sp. NPDC102360]|uniref:hypothetical protein n=1 Tax=Streptomyces sp. NPDC102360 TaxID=3366160 RepID=UPI0037F41B0D
MPGEELIAVCKGGLAPGVPVQPVWLQRPPQESELERRIKSRLPAPVQRFLQPPEPKPVSWDERMMEGAERGFENAVARSAHGKGMHGGWKSQAGQFLVAHYTAPLAVTLLTAFTDRRVLVFGDRAKFWQPTEKFELRWEVARAAVLGVRANPKGVLQRGRFELLFPDGSWIALVASVPTHAEPFAALVGY